MKEKSRPLVIGIAGGSGSGKTTFAQKIAGSISDSARIAILAQDSYYKDNAAIPMKQRLKINYDRPEAFDMPLFLQQLKQLIAGRTIKVPVYDFKNHTRSGNTLQQPADVIIVEGILVLAAKKLRDLMDIKVFVAADDDIRFIRRLERDMSERGRNLNSVIRQYLTTVKPMQEQFVAPSQRYADVIVPGGGQNQVACDLLQTKIKSFLQARQ